MSGETQRSTRPVTGGGSAGALAEMTVRAVVTGCLAGALFGAANAYLGLRVGMTVSTSIPVAVITVALFRATGKRASILEANMAQTIGSASTSLATGGIFTLPALFLWGLAPPYWQIVVVSLLGGILGISAMIPLRDLLIVRSARELPYPEGTACAEVLRATSSSGGSGSGGAWIFRGVALGAAVKVALALFSVAPGAVTAAIPVLPNAELAIEVAPALVAVGYILGYRQSAVIVSGSLVSALVLIPLLGVVGAGLTVPLAPETKRLIAEMGPSDLWGRYVRYIGAGAVATAGITTVIRTLPAMGRSIAAVVRGLRDSGRERSRARTERDLPGFVMLGGVGIVLVAVAAVPGVLGGELGIGPRLVSAAAVGVLGVAFVTVAARIVGIVGVSSQPTSGITIITLLAVCGIFVACGWTMPGAKVAVLLVGAIVAIAASKAGDISQDLKTGQLVGATPALQQLGQYIGAATACWAVAGTLLFLSKAYAFGSPELPAPQATLMKTIIEGVLSGTLPWKLVLSGAGLSAAAMLAGVAGLPFAIGVYLPLATMAAIFVGGCVRAIVTRLAEGRARGEARVSADGAASPETHRAEDGAGVLAASGLVAGEGLAGVLVAALIGGLHVPHAAAPLLAGGAGKIASLAILAAVAVFLVRAGLSRDPRAEPTPGAP
jgi:putative OPT family oligopeptide transporter